MMAKRKPSTVRVERSFLMRVKRTLTKQKRMISRLMALNDAYEAKLKAVE